jgi:hypothetical protein
MSINRRSSQRHTVELQARLAVDGQFHDVTIQNLSLGGAQITYDQRMAMGQRVQLVFQLPSRDDAVEVGATVRWNGSDSIGLQFEGLRARDVWALTKFFESLA